MNVWSGFPGLGKRLAALVVLAPLVLCAAPPNILFIMTDQQCADAMSGRMGDAWLKTPAMDSLARSGMVFTQAYSPNPLCMPARNAIFTGRHPHETGVTKNEPVRLDTAAFTDLGTHFRRAGYETAYFGKRHLCFKVEDGFEVAGPQPKKEHDVQTTAGAVEYLGRTHDRPFLLVVSLMNPHNVCELARHQTLPDGPIGAPPPPDRCPPAPANLAPQLDEPDTMTVLRRGYHASDKFPVGGYTADDWRQLRWGYYRLIEKVDAQIGAVLDALRKAGREEDTLVVFTSDHGECAGAHGFNQKTVLYEESVRVPLIVSFKGRTRSGTCDRLVNTGLDLLPTLMEFADIPRPEKLTGRSLRALALGETVTGWRDHVVIENDLDQAGTLDGFHPTAQGRLVRSERYAYCIYNRGERRESLVDLAQDPGETKNLARDPAFRPVLLEHRALLAAYAVRHGDTLATAMLADDVKPLPFPAKRKP